MYAQSHCSKALSRRLDSDEGAKATLNVEARSGLSVDVPPSRLPPPLPPSHTQFRKRVLPVNAPVHEHEPVPEQVP
jgi:hypothetical protein